MGAQAAADARAQAQGDGGGQQGAAGPPPGRLARPHQGLGGGVIGQGELGGREHGHHDGRLPGREPRRDHRVEAALDVHHGLADGGGDGLVEAAADALHLAVEGLDHGALGARHEALGHVLEAVASHHRPQLGPEEAQGALGDGQAPDLGGGDAAGMGQPAAAIALEVLVEGGLDPIGLDLGQGLGAQGGQGVPSGGLVVAQRLEQRDHPGVFHRLGGEGRREAGDQQGGDEGSQHHGHLLVG
ncbi:MAG: hypothetical protein R3F43_13135 [bacterium]